MSRPDPSIPAWSKWYWRFEKLSTIQEIERAISRLPLKDLTRFREWFEEFDAKVWDKQLEADAKAGKLDKAASQALNDFRAGKCKEL